MAEDLIIELESHILGLKRTELVQFGEEMKWISTDEIGEKGRLELIKTIRSAFEEEVQKSDSEQLTNFLEKVQSVLHDQTGTQADENAKTKEKSIEELKQLQQQYENMLLEQEALKDKITAMQNQNETGLAINKSQKQEDDVCTPTKCVPLKNQYPSTRVQNTGTNW